MREEQSDKEQQFTKNQHFNEELEQQIDFLMSAALQKCGNLQDAEELTQETLLSALNYMSQGNQIENMRGWLVTVLNRRFYDRMRRKYRRPFIGIGTYAGSDIYDDEALIEKISAAEEAEKVRREVAYLAKIYREVIVRHYMDGESVSDIAAALNIPEGTVKRRLFTGRSQIRKGMDNDMKNYTSQSYQPVTLHVGNSGGMGMKGEPASLVAQDLVAQNLLWLAYEKPVTIEELSRAIGIPAAYVEPAVEKLTGGELMRRTGNKYYTDFMISTIEEQERYIPAQKRFVQEHFDDLWKNIGLGIEKIRKSDLYGRFNSDQQKSLEMYFAFKNLEGGYYGVFEEIFRNVQVFPDRPNGGSWIAIGRVRFSDYDPEKHRDYEACRWSGERWGRFDDYGDARRIELHVYGTEGFPAPTYNHSFDNILLPSPGEMKDAMLLKLLYILHSGCRPGQLGFNQEILKAVPGLVQSKVLRLENGKPKVNIPIMDKKELRDFFLLCKETSHALIADNRELFRTFFNGKRQHIPTHLDSVPLQKQYLWSNHAMMLSTIREAIRHGALYDGDYDNVSGKNPVPCPMILMIEQ